MWLICSFCITFGSKAVESLSSMRACLGVILDDDGSERDREYHRAAPDWHASSTGVAEVVVAAVVAVGVGTGSSLFSE
jgi:hypothetical protein